MYNFLHGIHSLLDEVWHSKFKYLFPNSVSDCRKAWFSSTSDPKFSCCCWMNEVVPLHKVQFIFQLIITSFRVGLWHYFIIHTLTSRVGMSNNAGFSRISSRIAEEDSHVVKMTRAAGGIPLLVSNTPELCKSWETYNSFTGRTNNPYDTRRTPGGSSGGEVGMRIDIEASFLFYILSFLFYVLMCKWKI